MKMIETRDLAYATFLRVLGYPVVDKRFDINEICYWSFEIPDGENPYLEWSTGAKVPAITYAKTLTALKRDAMAGPIVERR